MVKRYKLLLVKIAYVLIDAFFITSSIIIACWIREGALGFPFSIENLFIESVNPFRFILVFWLLAIIVLNNSHGLYQTRREVQESLEVWNVIKSVAMASILAIVAVYIFKISRFPRSVLILGGAFITFSLSLWRIFKRMFVEYLVVNGYNNLNILIVGADKVGAALAEEIEKRPSFGLKVVGFLDDTKEKGSEFANHKVLGKVSDFRQIARSEFINKIFITAHHDNDKFVRLLEEARYLRVAIRVIPQGFEFTTGEFTKYNIGYIPVLEYCDEEFLVNQIGKRVFDFVSSFLALIVLMPFFVIIAILIKLESRGPVFYYSKRYGRRGQIFPMFKFRSMVSDADKRLNEIRDKNEVDGPIFKIRNDPRVTKFGRFLRKYSIDELPQLINVLKGDMSLVGPRPLPIEQIQKEDLKQLERLEVRPGITGLWQIRGRSDVSFVRLVKWDVWYIHNWSFWLDLNILIQTIPIVLKGRGAY